MEKFDLQVMLSDGSFADYIVHTEREAKTFKVLQNEELIASFKALPNGSWELVNNPAEIDDDLQHRIEAQLNGFRV